MTKKKSIGAEKSISSETLEGRAKLLTYPEVGNAIIMDAFCKGLGEQSINELITALRENSKGVNDGTLDGVESMLACQAQSLQTIFTELSRRAAMNMGEYIGAVETYMRLALKAQAQCRSTLQTLAEIKNPRPVAFVKQANIAHGPQQVNNGTTPRAENSANQSNKLSGASHELLPDTRASQVTVGVNQELETVGAINGAAN